MKRICSLGFLLTIRAVSCVDIAKDIAVKKANSYADWSAENCKKIGSFGNEIVKEGSKILTHCNAGALACVDYGTALAPMRAAHENNKEIFVFVDETRPRLQGSRLTAFELAEEGIKHAIIADNAAGHYMKNGEIDLVITGADRIAANGDVANKIGTYTKAVLAKEHGIPFYVAAPSSTIDFDTATGEDIPIEERKEEETLHAWGLSDQGVFQRVRTSPKSSNAKNPAFDVTPAELITGIITEKGIFKPGEIRNIKEA